MTRMFSIFCETGAVVELSRVTSDEMTSMLRDSDYKAIPVYFSDDGRVWPKKGDRVVLAKELQSTDASKE